MNLQENMDLQKQFEAAVARVDSLPADKAAAHMTDLYGLYKQATEGDHDTEKDVVGDDSPSNPSGQEGMSQAQWDSWSKFKGVSEADARRQYIQKVDEIAGPVGEKANVIVGSGQPATGSQVNSNSPAAEAQQQAGVSQGGLRGDLSGGAPYGGEDKLTEQQ
ncbi:acyl-CoA-binding protein [Hymenobacter yonginensis]|uniref:Acyl-CoA-binding protein n=1 Tax=Hymenobacter yonginensis TaxID=748197 RepID=A0ABY7PNV9_9BACT|nr:acyl-CoA-binding protein [Hymenobacter yonginensis]WBO84951.1 acyl-CoA-binding protein [Hymenobacter yonginensis]